ncbi:MAG: Nitroreductase, partial [uncultured Nocardioidaceae bacterium]
DRTDTHPRRPGPALPRGPHRQPLHRRAGDRGAGARRPRPGEVRAHRDERPAAAHGARARRRGARAAAVPHVARQPRQDGRCTTGRDPRGRPRLPRAAAAHLPALPRGQGRLRRRRGPRPGGRVQRDPAGGVLPPRRPRCRTRRRPDGRLRRRGHRRGVLRRPPLARDHGRQHRHAGTRGRMVRPAPPAGVRRRGGGGRRPPRRPEGVRPRRL